MASAIKLCHVVASAIKLCHVVKFELRMVLATILNISLHALCHVVKFEASVIKLCHVVASVIKLCHVVASVIKLCHGTVSAIKLCYVTVSVIKLCHVLASAISKNISVMWHQPVPDNSELQCIVLHMYNNLYAVVQLVYNNPGYYYFYRLL